MALPVTVLALAVAESVRWYLSALPVGSPTGRYSPRPIPRRSRRPRAARRPQVASEHEVALATVAVSVTEPPASERSVGETGQGADRRLGRRSFGCDGRRSGQADPAAKDDDQDR